MTPLITSAMDLFLCVGALVFIAPPLLAWLAINNPFKTEQHNNAEADSPNTEPPYYGEE